MTRSPLMDSNLDAVHPQISGPTAVLLPSACIRTPSIRDLGIIATFGFAAGEFYS
jgi:hypothetical protein